MKRLMDLTREVGRPHGTLQSWAKSHNMRIIKTPKGQAVSNADAKFLTELSKIRGRRKANFHRMYRKFPDGVALHGRYCFMSEVRERLGISTEEHARFLATDAGIKLKKQRGYWTMLMADYDKLKNFIQAQNQTTNEDDAYATQFEKTFEIEPPTASTEQEKRFEKLEERVAFLEATLKRYFQGVN